MIVTIGLVIHFDSLENLASAYGLVVSADIVITTILAFFVALRFGWGSGHDGSPPAPPSSRPPARRKRRC
jgi:hypothetical protein